MCSGVRRAWSGDGAIYVVKNVPAFDANYNIILTYWWNGNPSNTNNGFVQLYDEDLVVHNASRLNHVLPYQALRRDNVEPTRGLLELAATTKRKGFVLVSTAGVLQGENGGTFDEDVRVEDIGQSVREGYNASKWVSELMVRRAARAGMGSQPGLRQGGSRLQRPGHGTRVV